MAAPPNKPHIQKSTPPLRPGLDPARLIPSPPSSTVAGAVAAAKKQVDTANRS